jgi:translocator protein
MTRLISLVPFLVLTFAAAAVGSQFRPGAWYAALLKPAWTPPNWLFGPVWTVLYVMIAVAGWIAWRRQGKGAALAIWLLGLAANAAWSWLFFGRQMIGGALVDIVIVWLSIAAFIAVTWRDSRPASLLFVPYLAWVSYATALNAALWRLNG